MRLPEVFRGTCVIPAMFLGNFAISMSFSAIPDLLMQKTCSPDGEPEEIDFICNNTYLVAQATGIATSRNTVRSVLAALCIPAFASWRDRSCRSKPLLIVGMAAEMMGGLFYMASILYWPMSAWVPAMAEAVIGGIFGHCVCQLGANCIIIENSSPDHRIMKLQMYVTTLFLSSCMASTVYGFILTEIGYLWFFVLLPFLHVTSIVLTAILVTEEEKLRVRKKGVCSELISVFRWRRNCSVVWLMLLALSIMETVSSAENSVFVYFLQQGFHFKIQQEGLFDAYYSLVITTGSFVFSFIFTRILKFTEFKIGILSALVSTVAGIFLSLAKTKLQLYIFINLYLLKCFLYSVPECVISKCVKHSKLGKFLSVGSIMGSLLPVGVDILYNDVFSSTSATMPGAFFLLSSAANFLIFLIFWISLRLYNPQDVDKSENGTIRTEPVTIWVVDKCRVK